jgi:hypothetical protein
MHVRKKLTPVEQGLTLTSSSGVSIIKCFVSILLLIFFLVIWTEGIWIVA